MSEHLLIQGWGSSVSLYYPSTCMSLPLWMSHCSRSEPCSYLPCSVNSH